MKRSSAHPRCRPRRPTDPVPAPRGTIGTRSSAAIRTSSATSAVVVGKTTARGRPAWRYGGLVDPGSSRGRGCRSAGGGRGGARSIAATSGSASWSSGRLVGRHAPSLRARTSVAANGRRGRMAPMSQRTPIILAAPRRRRSRSSGPASRSAPSLLAAEAGPARRSDRSLPPELEPAAASEIVPGSVGRSSLFLDATYDAYAADLVDAAEDLRRLDGDDPQHLGCVDRPGRAQHDRRATRQHPAPLGHGRRGRHGRHAERPDDRRPARRHLAGRMPRPRIRVRFHALLRSTCPARTGCSPRRTGSSTSTAGCRGSAAGSPSTGRTTATRSRRRRAAPSGSGSSPRGRWSWPRAATGPRSAPTA